MTKEAGWTLAQWEALPPLEQELRLAYEIRRERDLDELIVRFQEKRLNDSGKEYSAWEPAAAAVLLAARAG